MRPPSRYLKPTIVNILKFMATYFLIIAKEFQIMLRFSLIMITSLFPCSVVLAKVYDNDQNRKQGVELCARSDQLVAFLGLGVTVAMWYIVICQVNILHCILSKLNSIFLPEAVIFRKKSHGCHFLNLALLYKPICIWDC